MTETSGTAPTEAAQAAGERPIDLVHLARMTFGDRGLEHEALQLFDRQAGQLMALMRGASPQSVAALAHRLKGSARGIGAWHVASAAEQVEGAVAGAPDLALALDRLAARTDEARALIAELLRTS
jgi:HPt (histidine-containing phosphotransfer) domain-containing protein